MLAGHVCASCNFPLKPRIPLKRPVTSNERDSAPSMGKRMDEPEEMEDFYEEEEVFLENAVHCPVCDELTGHEILTEKLKGTGKDYLLKCIDCSKVHTVHLRPPPVVEIPFILTEGPSSSTSKLEIDADEMIELEDVFKDGEKLWKINHH